MATDPEAVVRAAFSALVGGDVEGLLVHVDPDLEWTYLDPSEESPSPQVCTGRGQLGFAIQNDPTWAAHAELEELVASGDNVLVVTHVPGLDEIRARKSGDRNFHVVTVRDGKITALRACRDRAEAASMVGTA